MCYSGKCRYEYYSGDCSLNIGKIRLPFDAACVEAEISIEAIDRYNKEKPDMSFEDYLEAFIMLEKLKYEG